MKKRLFLFIFLLMIPFVFPVSYELKGFVNDYANIINDTQEQELNGILKQIYDSGVAQYSIITINSLEGKAVESVSLDIAQGKLGDKEKNNGLLLLVALEDKEYRFEVGRGIEAVLNDAKVGRIGRYYLVPNFRNQSYGKGIVEASLAVRSILLGDNASVYYISDEEDYSAEYEKMQLYFTLAIIIFFIVISILSSIARKKNKNKYFDAAAGAIILFGGRGGGRSGGFGGFGGFGGGGFGGGGAGGRW